MDSPGQERELLAIVFTDAVDSSHRTASNEDHSITLLLADLDYIRSEAEVRGGTVLKNTGDGLLIAFKSAVDAVECALVLQKGFNLRDDPNYFRHKVGVHIGDVIRKDGDIYGAGVNLASRLVSQCLPGEICLSSTLYELTKQKSEIGSLPLRGFSVQNVDPPVQAYLTGLVPSQPEKSEGSPQKKRNRLGLGLVTAGFTVVAVFLAFYVYRHPRSGAPSAGSSPASTVPAQETSEHAPANEEAGIGGYWQGSLTPSGLRVGLRILPQGEDWAATMDSIDQKQFGIPVEKLAWRDEQVNFEVPVVQASFIGAVDSRRRTFQGTFRQNGQENQLELLRLSAIDGTWEGTLPPYVGSLRVVLHLQSSKEGLKGRLDSPDQKAFGVPASKVNWNGKNLLFEIEMLGVVFQGVWSGLEKDLIEGVFEQGGKMPLVLKRTTPVPDYLQQATGP